MNSRRAMSREAGICDYFGLLRRGFPASVGLFNNSFIVETDLSCEEVVLTAYSDCTKDHCVSQFGRYHDTTGVPVFDGTSTVEFEVSSVSVVGSLGLLQIY